MKTFFRVGAMTLTVAGLCGVSTSMAQTDGQGSMSNQIVVRDATTGQLRAATPAEANALAGSAKVAPSAAGKAAMPAAAAVAQQPQRVHGTGARGVRLTDEFLNNHVLVRQPDGSFVTQCLHSAEEVAKFHQQPPVSTKTATAPTE